MDRLKELVKEKLLKPQTVREEEEGNIVPGAALVLPRGKEMILQAEEEDYKRGLLVTLEESGGYKIKYWYGDDVKVYPAEVVVDGESVKPDAVEVDILFHPELKESEITDAQKDKLKDMIKSLRKSSKGHAGQAKYLNKSVKDELVDPKREKIKDMIKSLKKSSKGHAGQADYLSKLIKEKLCKKGEAYRKRRMAAGEKSSAYLSGRAVKVCKGQMSGRKKKTSENVAPNHNGKAAPYGSGYKKVDIDEILESLRDWFKKEDWVRINTSGNISGPCGTMKKGKATTRCLPRKKAQSLTKAERKATVAKKVRGDKKGKQFVKNTEKAEYKKRK